MLEVTGNIVSQLSETCKKYAGLNAYTLLGRDLSYRELDELSDDLAAYLLHHTQLESGDRVAIQLPNILQYPIGVLAVMKASMIIVNTNPEYSEDELKHQLNDSGAKALIILSGCAKTFLSIQAQTSVEEVIITNIADLHSPLKRSLLHTLGRVMGGHQSCLEFPRLLKFKKALSLGKEVLTEKSLNKSDLKQAENIDNNNVAVLQYTGGTTGTSKGAMLTHRNLISNFMQLKEQLGEDCPGSESIVIAPLPFYHVYAFTVNILFSLMMGYHNILIANPRLLSLFVRDIKSYKINIFCGINPLFKKLCEHPEFHNVDFSQLKICTSGGMTLAKDIAERWHEVTGCKILEGYGMTETSPLAACNVYQDYQTDSIGKALPHTELKVIDEQGNTLEQSLEGELCIRGPQVMVGYWQQADETAAVLDAEGWLRTGDIASIDATGNLKIIDRLKDMIIVSGFNVYPVEIESVVREYPGVKEVVVIGVKNSDSVEQVKLIVVPEDPLLDKIALLDYCKSKLAAYKVPKIIEYRDSLPLSNVGKVLKRELKLELAEQKSTN
ncbi:MAG: AMP-binding protein [Gammaproteobacteria bacterium]|nr:AMP-binding protein [Gammaproteobacteria bacterium]